MSKPNRTIMNVEVAPSVRSRFNAICDKRGLKKNFVMTNIILEFLAREEKTTHVEGHDADGGATSADGRVGQDNQADKQNQP